MSNNVLIATLFSDVKDYVIKDWFKNVCKFTYPFDLCLVDNSKDKKYHKKMFKYFSERKKNSNIGKLTVLHTPRVHKKAEIFLAFSANELRKHFLRHGYPWFFNLECDIFPPTDIIERLLSYNQQIIGCTYFTDKGRSSRPMLIDVALHKNYTPVSVSYLEGFYKMKDYTIPQNIFMQGLGAVLIYKDILQKIPFEADKNGITYYDTVFYKELFKQNIQNKFVPIMCRHENRTWDIQNKLIA